MSNIPYLEQLTNDEVVTASKAANLALQVQRLANQGTFTLPYKSYVASLNQASNLAPQATIAYSDLGGTIVWTYSSTGQYIGTLSGAFTADKTLCIVSAPSYSDLLNKNSYSLRRTGNNTVQLASTSNSIETDGILSDKLIEIRVYN
jgi:hypothetical protein